MMFSRATDVMTTKKKIRHDSHTYQENDRFYLNCSKSSRNRGDKDCSSPSSVLHSLQGTSMLHGVLADLEKFRVLGPDPSNQSGLAMIPRHGFCFPSPVLHPSGGNSMPRVFSSNFHVVETEPSTQRTSRTFDVESLSLRVDTIEIPRHTLTTPSSGAEANDAPIDLSTSSADNRRRTLTNQTSLRSQNSAPYTGLASSGAYDPRPESDGRERSTQKAATPQLPLFVNLENSRLDSLQLGLHSSHDTLENENQETQSMIPPGWTTMMDWMTDPEVEAPRRQKSAIDRLRAHLERRQEARPATNTAYASLNKRLATIEATGSRYETMHDGMFGALKEASEPKTFLNCTTEVVDTQGRSLSNVHHEQETQRRHLEVQDQPSHCLSGVTIEGLQPGQHDQRLKEMKSWLQSGTRGYGGPHRDGERPRAAPLEYDETSRQEKPSAVSFRRHPPIHSHASNLSMAHSQTDIHQQDKVLSKTSLDPPFSVRPDFGVPKYAIGANLITLAGKSSRSGKEPEPDSPSSYSLPDFSIRSDVAACSPWQASQRSASIDTGFPSSQNSFTKNDVAMMGRGWIGSGRTLEACSPDQSTDYKTYKADNLPSIIASARLDDDCDFPTSFAETLKETLTREHQPMDKFTNASFRNRRNAALGGIVGSGKGSSPEPPSSTFEDEPMADKSKDKDTNTKSTESTIPCKICQDVANGFHYGVWSCEGCKAFFKRSITGSAKYVCPADNNCTINRLRKKSCQACRLRKCYEYGMSPGNCRAENGSKSRKRKLQEANLTDRKESVTSDQQTTLSSASNRSSSGNISPHDFRNHPTLAEPASGPVSFLQHLVDLERPIRFAELVDARTMMNSEESEQIQLLTSITKLINLQLMDVVTWSLSLKGFNALHLNIRTHLLVNSWSDVLLLTSAFYSIQCTNAIVMAPNLHLTKERCEMIGMMALYNRLMAVVRSFQQLVVTHNEMLLMQAVLLVNGDLIPPQLLPRLDEMRASLMREWYQSCSGGQGQGHDDRISRLLLLLPHIRHCSIIFLRFLADLRRDNRIPVYGLLQEVTDSRQELDQVSVLELLVEDEIRFKVVKHGELRAQGNSMCQQQSE